MSSGESGGTTPEIRQNYNVNAIHPWWWVTDTQLWKFNEKFFPNSRRIKQEGKGLLRVHVQMLEHLLRSLRHPCRHHRPRRIPGRQKSLPTTKPSRQVDKLGIDALFSNFSEKSQILIFAQIIVVGFQSFWIRCYIHLQGWMALKPRELVFWGFMPYSNLDSTLLYFLLSPTLGMTEVAWLWWWSDTRDEVKL